MTDHVDIASQMPYPCMLHKRMIPYFCSLVSSICVNTVLLYHMEDDAYVPYSHESFKAHII